MWIGSICPSKQAVAIKRSLKLQKSIEFSVVYSYHLYIFSFFYFSLVNSCIVKQQWLNAYLSMRSLFCISFF